MEITNNDNGLIFRTIEDGFEFSGRRDRVESLPGVTESGSMRQLMLHQEFFDSAGDFFPMRFERKMARIQ